jgi:hypothetical protein
MVIAIPSGEEVLIFLGTNSLWTFLDNFRFYLLTSQGFPLGWYISALSTYQQVKDYNIIEVYGYSRGGAIALIYSYLYKLPCATFASPKVCSFELDWPIEPLLFSCKDDIVTKLPIGFYYPKNKNVQELDCCGHFWNKDKALLLPKGSCQRTRNRL